MSVRSALESKVGRPSALWVVGFRFFAPPLLVAVAGTTWHAVGQGRPSLTLLLWSVLTGSCSSALGFAFLAVLESRVDREDRRLSSLTAYLVGFFLLSCGLLLLAFISPFGIAINFAVLGTLSFAALCSPRVRAAWHQFSFARIEALALLLILVSAGFWSQENLRSLRLEGDVVISTPWQDIFFHALQVSVFARSDGYADLFDPLLSGRPLPLYHYGSYMIASLMCRLTDLDAYSIAAGWYAPMGMLLTGLAAWSLGASLLGTAGGLGAVFATMLVPDPSYYCLGNRWTSYFFFQTVGIGGAYSVAVLGQSWAFFFASLRAEQARNLTAALLFASLSLFYKATIFLVYASGVLVFGTLFLRGLGRWRKALLLAGLVMATAIGLFWIRRLPGAPTLAISMSGAQVNLEMILHHFPPPRFGSLQRYLEHHRNYPAELLVGIPLVLFSEHGSVVLAGAVAIWLSLRARLKRAWTLFPVWMLANHVFVALCLDSNHGPGDLYEVIHKTFVFPVFAVAAWSGATLLSRLGAFSSPTTSRLVCGISVLALAVGYNAGSSVQSGIPWAKLATRLAVPRGLYDAAHFIRTRSGKSAVVQYSENDERAILAGLAERGSFIVHYGLDPNNAPSQFEAGRLEQVEDLLQLGTSDSARARAADLGIDWLLLSADRRPPWAEQLSPDFESRGFRLYRIGDPETN
jgi:hypothetical protein